MFIALVTYNVVHPGRVMRGTSKDMPSDWELRKQKKQEMFLTDTPLAIQADSVLKV